MKKLSTFNKSRSISDNKLEQKLQIAPSKKSQHRNRRIGNQSKQNGVRYHACEPPTKTTVLRAMHLCPAAPKPAATKAFTVASTFASGMTIA